VVVAVTRSKAGGVAKPNGEYVHVIKGRGIYSGDGESEEMKWRGKKKKIGLWEDVITGGSEFAGGKMFGRAVLYAGGNVVKVRRSWGNVENTLAGKLLGREGYSGDPKVA